MTGNSLRFAMTTEQPNAVAVIEWDRLCWPVYDRDHAREVARDVGVFGFWRLKAKEVEE